MAGRNNVLEYRRPKSLPAVSATHNEDQQSTRLTLGNYFADIVPDHDGLGPVFHWVVQRAGSPEILRMGQEQSFAHALDRSHECLENLALRNDRRAGRRAVFYEFGELK